MVHGLAGHMSAPEVGTGAPSYKGFRFPVEIISHCVWLYYRFPLSLREVEEMMLARGVTVSHEGIVNFFARRTEQVDDATVSEGGLAH